MATPAASEKMKARDPDSGITWVGVPPLKIGGLGAKRLGLLMNFAEMSDLWMPREDRNRQNTGKEERCFSGRHFVMATSGPGPVKMLP